MKLLPYPADFLDFWHTYPRRTAKADAFKAWQALAPNRDDLRAMLTALGWQVEQPDWRKDNGAFIPYPATWLRAHRWEDEPFAPTQLSLATKADRTADAARHVASKMSAMLALTDGDA